MFIITNKTKVTFRGLYSLISEVTFSKRLFTMKILSKWREKISNLTITEIWVHSDKENKERFRFRQTISIKDSRIIKVTWYYLDNYQTQRNVFGRRDKWKLKFFLYTSLYKNIGILLSAKLWWLTFNLFSTINRSIHFNSINSIQIKLYI